MEGPMIGDQDERDKLAKEGGNPLEQIERLLTCPICLDRLLLFLWFCYPPSTPQTDTNSQSYWRVSTHFGWFFSANKSVTISLSNCSLPCLESYVESTGGRPRLRCPECRAEHGLSLDGGVHSLQTNLTLLSFLEIHMEASAANAAEMQAYVQRCASK